jgi:protein SCO1
VSRVRRPRATGVRPRVRRHLRAVVPLLLLALATGLSGCGGGTEPVATITSGDDDGLHGAVLVKQYVAPELELTDTSGDPYSLAADTDKPLTLVFFGYTHCPDICPLTMANIASAMSRLSDEQRAQVDVVVVTTDPARDDAATLRAWLDRFDPDFIGLTGTLSTIREVGDEMGVFLAKGKKMPDGGYEVDHGTPLLALDAADRCPVVWTQGFSPQDLAEDVAAMLAHPDQFGQEQG